MPAVELKTAKRFSAANASFANSIGQGVRTELNDWRDLAPITFAPCQDQDIASVVTGLFQYGCLTTQIIAPVRKVFGGTECINESLQRRISGYCPKIQYWNVEHSTFHTASFSQRDIVLCTRNLRDKDLQNGSLGQIVEFQDNTDPANCKPHQILAWIDWDDRQ